MDDYDKNLTNELINLKNVRDSELFNELTKSLK